MPYIQYSSNQILTASEKTSLPLPMEAASYSHWILQQNSFCRQWSLPGNHKGHSVFPYLICLWITSSMICQYRNLFTHSDKETHSSEGIQYKPLPESNSAYFRHEPQKALNSSSRNSQLLYFGWEQDNISVQNILQPCKQLRNVCILTVDILTTTCSPQTRFTKLKQGKKRGEKTPWDPLHEIERNTVEIYW